MKTRLSVVLLTFHCLFGFSQTAIFDDYDFDAGGYSLLMRPMQWYTTDIPQNPFYFDAIDRLNGIKSQFVLKEIKREDDRYCYPEISLLICRNGQILESMSLCSNARLIQVISTGQTYGFDGYFPMHGYTFARFKDSTFHNVETARTALELLSGSPGLLCILPPLWKEMDGEFTFECYDQPQKPDEIETVLQAAIEKQYPNEKFQLRIALLNSDWLRGNDYRVTVRCRKTLYDRFNLYRRKPDEWRPYKLNLEIFWKE